MVNGCPNIFMLTKNVNNILNVNIEVNVSLIVQSLMMKKKLYSNFVGITEFSKKIARYNKIFHKNPEK